MGFLSELILFPLILRLFNFRHEGLEKISKKENYIFAMNHCSAIDVIFALSVIVPYSDKKLSIVLDSRWYDFPLLHPILKNWGAIRIDAAHPEKRREIIFEAKKALEKGNSLLIFPEGATIGGAIGEPVKAYTGAVQIAIRSKKKIIPVGITGSFDAWKFPTSVAMESETKKIPEGIKCGYENKFRIPVFNYIYNFFEFNFTHPVKMHFGKEIDLGEHYKKDLNIVSDENKKTLRELTRQLMMQIAELAGQKYRYASE